MKFNYKIDDQFVGDRPFDVDSKVFMRLAKQGQQILDDAFNREESLKQ